MLSNKLYIKDDDLGITLSHLGSIQVHGAMKRKHKLCR